MRASGRNNACRAASRSLPACVAATCCSVLAASILLLLGARCMYGEDRTLVGVGTGVGTGSVPSSPSRGPFAAGGGASKSPKAAA